VLIVGQVLNNFIAKLFVREGTNLTERKIRDLLDKRDVRFAVLGARACGKTTLINRILGRPIYSDYSSTIGEDPIGKFEYVGLTERVVVHRFSDFGGDESFWSEWDDAFTRDQPNGFIFMIDHEYLDQHQRAFRFL